MVSGTFGSFNDLGNFIAISGQGLAMDGSLLVSSEGSLEALATYARATGAPVWVEYEAGERRVVDIWFAETGIVRDVTELSDRVVVDIMPLTRPIYVDYENYPRLAALLDRSRKELLPIMLISDDEDRLLDAIASNDVPAIFDIQDEPPSLDENEITAEQASVLFRDVMLFDSGPVPTSRSGIPFLYPDDGCWARAHRMGEVASDTGIVCQKVWLYGSLAVLTANNPTCSVRWGYHVAICVQIEGDGPAVIDPSMFDAPVPLRLWIGAQSDPHANLHSSSSRVYYRPEIGRPLSYDDDRSRTAGVLTTYCGKLLRRSQQKGPPPYRQCST